MKVKTWEWVCVAVFLSVVLACLPVYLSYLDAMGSRLSHVWLDVWVFQLISRMHGLQIMFGHVESSHTLISTSYYMRLLHRAQSSLIWNNPSHPEFQLPPLSAHLSLSFWFLFALYCVILVVVDPQSHSFGAVLTLCASSSASFCFCFFCSSFYILS